MSDVYTISNGSASASVSTAGAQLMSLKKGGEEYLWQRDPQWWPRCAPVLFPIVGNIRDDRAESPAGEIKLGRHGIARSFEHELVEAVEDKLVFSLSSDDETRAQFPYDFRLQMSYELVGEATLAQTFAVTNTGDVELPFCVGGHPAFNVPLASDAAAGERFEDFELRFAQAWSYASPTISTETGLIDWSARFELLDDSDALPITHRLFDVDTLIWEDVPQRSVSLVGRKSGHGVRLDFPGFDYLGVWSAANDAPFVAVEPWTGVATGTDEDDDFTHKRGIELLAPGATSTHCFTITML
jgi:galactose mutarotase-like enzyme